MQPSNEPSRLHPLWMCACLLVVLSLLACGEDSKKPSNGGDDADMSEADMPQDDLGDCSPGTEGCRCLSDDTCRLSSLSCVDGICEVPTVVCDPALGPCPPANPICYSPCRGDLIDADGQRRRCSPDGLMEGCVGGAMCDRGTCVPVSTSRLPLELAQGQSAGDCASDEDCPAEQNCIVDTCLSPGECQKDGHCADYQRCLQNRCYSDCEGDSQCGPDVAGNTQVCYRRVCRSQCDDSQPCPSSTVCSQGVCIPTNERAAQDLVLDGSSLDLGAETIKFSGGVTSFEIPLFNTGENDLDVTIEKIEQVTLNPEGVPEKTLLNPLAWLQINGEDGESVSFKLSAGEVATLSFSNAATPAFTRWEGRVEVSAPGAARREIRLVYNQEASGRWVGKIYTFGNFNDGAMGQDRPLDDWMADRGNQAHLNEIPNAFLQAWGRFRNGALDAAEMEALLDATLTGSWDFPRVRALCAERYDAENTLCAPFGGAGSRAVIPYTNTALNTPIPSGVIEQDFALHLRNAGDGECDEDNCLVGRIDSATSLQYAANPAVALSFTQDPTTCATENELGCVAYLNHLDAEVAVGARIMATFNNAGSDYKRVSIPWLVPGFEASGVMQVDGAPYRVEWRDKRLPFEDGDLNADFAAANPLVDGRTRRRRLELVDGLMYEQQVMSLLLRESIDSFHGGPPLVSYHYVVLERAPDQLTADQIDGNVPPATPQDLRRSRALACDADMVRMVTGGSADITALGEADADKVALAMIDGRVGPTAELPTRLRTYSLCIWEEDTVVNTDQGTLDDSSVIQRQVINAGAQGNRPCFPGAQVIYFATTVANLEDNDCNRFQNNGTGESCLDELNNTLVLDGTEIHFSPQAQSLIEAGDNVSFDLQYRCVDERVGCDQNRLDLRAGKEFYLSNGSTSFFTPLDTEIAQAFRYKVQFVDRSGVSVGFAPTTCDAGARLRPYCYDPMLIDQVRDRVDCALALYHGHLGGAVQLSTDARDMLKDFLARNFGQLQSGMDDPVLDYGFERLYSELLIMLGDDAYTKAFASRFDLAGNRLRAFEGSLFETDGIDLSGAAGYEMYQLHLAAQYYDLVLERFYSMVVWMWENIEGEDNRRYVSAATLNTFLDRVIRASTQSANAWSEVARRYQSFNRRELAQRVVERTYVRTHQESLLLNAFMNQATAAVSAEELPQVQATIDNTQRRYRVAMLDMQERYREVSADLDFFGVPPDLIPFPALDEDAVNGFEVMLDRARARLDLASEDEEKAIASRRDFDSDQASFQNELVSLRNNYEAELGRLCGTFLGEDGRTYPAIARYAHLSPTLSELDDPCGAAGNGDLWLAGADLQTRELELRQVRQEGMNNLAAIEDESERTRELCKYISADTDEFLRTNQIIDNYNDVISGFNLTINQLDKTHDTITEVSSRINDAVSDLDDGVTIPFVGIIKTTQNAIYLGSALVNQVATGILEGLIAGKESQIRDLEREYEAYQISRECDYARLESGYVIRALERELLLTELDMLNAMWNVQVQFSSIQSLVNERNRLETEWAESEQMLINVEAARNDPNIRIYRNDSIINADRSFEAALREAWRLTKVYEYYTASSYPDRERLFLVRTVNYGDINLRRYVEDLEEDFLAFEQIYGNPDTRALSVSLRDDILQVPYYHEDGSGRVLTSAERTQRLRQAMGDPNNLNDEGALAFQFSTSFDQLSPLTTNHKILFIEVEFFGEDLGDNEGRIYLRQNGTGVVEGTDDRRRFFSFAPRTAVMNPFFNGERAFGQDSDGAITGPTRSLYRSYRFRERPFVQTNWELVLDQRSESVNQDINLNGLEDVMIYIYYTDFTREDL